MLVVDDLKKLCLLMPLNRQDVDELKRVFKLVIFLFGTPKLIVSDRGRMFESSDLNFLVGHESATLAIRSLVRDVAINEGATNRESRREMLRQKTAERLVRNRAQQDPVVNEDRRSPRVFQVNDTVFVKSYAQSQGELDPGMRDPYRVVKALRYGRYELGLLAGAYGKTSYAASQFMALWRRVDP